MTLALATLLLIITEAVDQHYLLWAAYGLFSSTGTLNYAATASGFSVDLTGRVNTLLNLLAFAGAFILQSGRRQIKELAGLGKVMPFSAGCYALATLSIMGLPPFSGFVSKFLMVYAAAEAGHYEVAVGLLVGGFAGE